MSDDEGYESSEYQYSEEGDMEEDDADVVEDFYHEEDMSPSPLQSAPGSSVKPSRVSGERDFKALLKVEHGKYIMLDSKYVHIPDVQTYIQI